MATSTQNQDIDIIARKILIWKFSSSNFEMFAAKTLDKGTVEYSLQRLNCFRQFYKIHQASPTVRMFEKYNQLQASEYHLTHIIRDKILHKQFLKRIMQRLIFILEEGLSSEPQPQTVLLLLVLFNQQLLQYQAAIMYIQKLLKMSQNISYILMKISNLYQLKRCEQALRLIQQTNTDYRNQFVSKQMNAGFFQLQGKIYSSLGKYKLSKKCFQFAISYDIFRKQSYKQMVLMLINSCDLYNAIKYVQRYNYIFQDKISLIAAQTIIYFLMGQFDVVKSYLDEINSLINADDENRYSIWKYHEFIGQINVWTMNYRLICEPQLDSFSQFHYHYNSGRCYFRQKQYRKAIQHFQRCKEQQRQDNHPDYYILLCYLALNQNQSAMKTCKIFRKKNTKWKKFIFAQFYSRLRQSQKCITVCQQLKDELARSYCSAKYMRLALTIANGLRVDNKQLVATSYEQAWRITLEQQPANCMELSLFHPYFHLLHFFIDFSYNHGQLKKGRDFVRAIDSLLKLIAEINVEKASQLCNQLDRNQMMEIELIDWWWWN